MLLQGSNPCRSAIIRSHKSACVQKPPDFPGSAVARITMGRAHAVELAAHYRSAYRPSRLNCGRQTTLTARVPRADGLPLSNPLAGGGAAPGCRGRRDGLPAGDGVARGGGARPNRALSRSLRCLVHNRNHHLRSGAAFPVILSRQNSGNAPAAAGPQLRR